MRGGEKPKIEIHPLAHGELKDASALHERELRHEFLTRFGPGFLARYYKAFVESPYATALVARVPEVSGGERRLDGVLIGTFDTGAHYAYLVREHGWPLTACTVLQCLRRPKLAWDLLRTRLVRYARGVYRSLRYAVTSEKRESSQKSPERVGFLAYVATAGDRRGLGIGKALVEAYAEQARLAGLDRLELVTFPDERGAGSFYTNMNWTYGGERISRSGERYSLYKLLL